MEGDESSGGTNDSTNNFYPRPPRGGRRKHKCGKHKCVRFLSTPSARRATLHPCGQLVLLFISIHALREEGDPHYHAIVYDLPIFLSTPSARRATEAPAAPWVNRAYFYPRPPRGGRLRRAKSGKSQKKFLSTPSARRATVCSEHFAGFGVISIHALREEGDRPVPQASGRSMYFYPRPPRGGRRISHRILLAFIYFYPRPPRGGRRLPSHTFPVSFLFLSTPSARRATLPLVSLSETF